MKLAREHPDSEFLDSLADDLKNERLREDEKEQVDKLLNSYSVALQIYFDRHGRPAKQKDTEVQKAA